MSQDAAERPNCQKCGGMLIPSRNLVTLQVESLTCFLCGEVLYRNHPRRLPIPSEKASCMAGIPAHDKTKKQRRNKGVNHA